MKESKPDLGDIPAEEFRKHLHAVADWIADYRENIAQYRISPTAKPGAIAATIPATAPESAEPLADIIADVDRLIVPGVVHWAHPEFMGYFGCTTTAPGILAEMIAAALNVNAMTWRTSPVATELETVILGWLRQWLRLPEDFGGVVYDTASIGSMHALAVAREEAVGDADAADPAGLGDEPAPLGQRAREVLLQHAVEFGVFQRRDLGRGHAHLGDAGVLDPTNDAQRASASSNTHRPIFATSIGRWRRELASTDLQQIEAIAGADMAELGYTPAAASSLEPAHAVL